MVTQVIDPIRVPSINLSQAEMAEMEELIEQGALPKDFLERHFKAVEDNVFGADHKKDKRGDPIEQGIGSPSNMTRNCVEAYRKYGKHVDEPDVFKATLERMEADLKTCDARRKVEAEKARGKRRKAA